MKKLFILTEDFGDGSYYPRFTFNKEWIEKCKEANLCYPDLGCDGDGFHYSILNVPDECTLASLGIIHDCAKEKLNETPYF